MVRKHVALAGGLVLAAGAFSSTAYAVEDRFDYFQLQGTGTGELDGPGGSVDIEEGINLEAAKSVNDILFVRLSADSYNIDAPGTVGTETGLDFLSLGPGINVPLGFASVWAQVNYERLNFAGNVGNGPGAEVGAIIGDADGLRLGVSAHRAEPSFSGQEDIEYERYKVDGMVNVAENADLVLSYEEGTLETPGGDTDIEDMVSLGVRFGF